MAFQSIGGKEYSINLPKRISYIKRNKNQNGSRLSTAVSDARKQKKFKNAFMILKKTISTSNSLS